ERAAQEKKSAELERERAAARRRNQNTEADRAAERTQQKAAECAEREVHRAEEAVENLKRQLEDPALYINAEGVRRAGQLKADLAAAEAELISALEKWHLVT
ncbi:MAG TPA: hypothetical protein VGC44_14570, partial [Longimicrobiales bacterium]